MKEKVWRLDGIEIEVVTIQGENQWGLVYVNRGKNESPVNGAVAGQASPWWGCGISRVEGVHDEGEGCSSNKTWLNITYDFQLFFIH